MAESIVIQIDLDSQNVDDSLNKVEKSAENSSKKIEKSFSKNIEARFERISGSVEELNNTINAISEGVTTFGIATIGTVAAVESFRLNLFGIAKVLPQISQLLFLNSKNLFAVASSFGFLSLASLGLAKALEGVENSFLRAVRGISLIVAILTGSFAAAIAFAIVKVGEFVNLIGTFLVSQFQKSADSFVEYQRSLVVFNKTVENFNNLTVGKTGDLESYNQVISEISESYNLTASSLRLAAAEIVTVGSRLGLNEEQLQNLIKVTATYAKINKKDVFDTSVAIVGALQGNAQAVQALGIKLTEAANTTFALKNGLDRTFASLADGEQVTVRYNNLLAQYNQISSLATATTGTLSDQQDALQKNLEKLNASLGRGAALIERNNIGAFALNAVLNLVNERVVEAAGFFGALGARFLQVGGLLLKFSLQIFAVIKIFQVLNILLASDPAQSLFARSVPIFGKSLNQISQDFSGLGIKIDSLQSLFKVLAVGLKQNALQFLAFVSGVNVANLSLATFARGAIANAILGLKALGAALLPILTAIAPFVLAVGAIVGAFVSLRAAFQEIEKRTAAFTRLFLTLRAEFSGVAGFFTSFATGFRNVIESIQGIFSQFIGVLAFGFSKVFSLILKIAQKDPFGVISDNAKKSFASIAADLTKFSQLLVAANFDITSLGDSALASTTKIKELVEVNLNDLQRLRSELENVGKSPLQIIEQELAQRLGLIRNARNQELLTEQQFLQLRQQAYLDFNDKFIEIIKQQNKQVQSEQDQTVEQLARTFNQGIVRLLQEGFERLGAAFTGSKNAFEGFVGAVLGIIGDLAIQIGSTLVAIGIGIEQLKLALFALTGGPAIAAGLALIALGGALKSFSKGAVATGTPSSAAGTLPAQEPSPVTNPDDFRSNNQRVVVNIQGDVFDSDETGTRIASILTEKFQAEGVDVVRAV